MRTDAAVLIIFVSLAMMLAGPVTSAAVPGDNRLSGPIVTGPELNVTGVDIANLSIPTMTPTIIRVEVAISDTPLPAQKGEMAAGPRSIGLVPLAVLVLGMVAVAAGMWYIVKRKPDEDTEEEPEKP
jgi:hypothetical protein